MWWIVGAAVLVVLAGCGTETPTGPSPGTEPAADELEETEWVLAEGVPLVEGYPITLRIGDGEGGGTAACNSYGGTLSVVGDRIEIGELGHTEMACSEPGVHESESAYLQALQAVERYEHTEGQLMLLGPGVELRFDTVEPSEDAPLTGTGWRLESLISGTGPEGTVSSTMAGATLLSTRTAPSTPPTAATTSPAAGRSTTPGCCRCPPWPPPTWPARLSSYRLSMSTTCCWASRP